MCSRANQDTPEVVYFGQIRPEKGLEFVPVVTS